MPLARAADLKASLRVVAAAVWTVDAELVETVDLGPKPPDLGDHPDVGACPARVLVGAPPLCAGGITLDVEGRVYGTSFLNAFAAQAAFATV